MSSANAYRYPKPPLVRSQLAKMLGDGLLVTEGSFRLVTNPTRYDARRA